MIGEYDIGNHAHFHFYNGDSPFTIWTIAVFNFTPKELVMGAYSTMLQERVDRRYREAVKDAKNWWKSLDASQREAGFHHSQGRFLSVVMIKIILPYTGECHVVRFSMYGAKSRTVVLTEKQRDCIRLFAQRCKSRGWTINQDSTGYSFWRVEHADGVSSSSPSQRG